VSTDASAQFIESRGLRESLAEICASQREFHRFFSGVFAELDLLSGELVRRHQAWRSERKRTEEEFEERDGQLEGRRAAIFEEREKAWEEVERRRREVEQERARVAAAGAESDGQLRQMLEEADRERETLRSALETARAEGDCLGQLAEELALTRAEQAEARQEIERLLRGLENVSAGAAQPQTDKKLQKQLQRLEQQRAKLDQDRLVLESELEMVRNRAAEMSEMLAGQQQQMAEERAQWAQEFKRMRRLLETFSSRQPEPEAQAESKPNKNAVDAREEAEWELEPAGAPAARGDPVLGSVMAQFEMLQKDIVRRRRACADGN